VTPCCIESLSLILFHITFVFVMKRKLQQLDSKVYDSLDISIFRYSKEHDVSETGSVPVYWYSRDLSQHFVTDLRE
jgi:hypothetical protein